MATVAIVIPCYNAEPWLEATVASVRAQTFVDWEAVIVDDGSKDNSVSIARGLTDEKVTLLTGPNSGAAAARNRGLAATAAPYVQFLDADDLLHPQKLALQIAAVDKLPADRLLTGAWARFLAEPTEADFDAQPITGDLAPDAWLRQTLRCNDMVHPAAWLTPRTLIDAAGPWNESLSLNDDGEFFARITQHASGLHYVAEARSYYRSGLMSSLSKTRSIRAWQSGLTALCGTCEALLALSRDHDALECCAIALRRFELEVLPYQRVLAHEARKLADGYCQVPPQPSGGPVFQRIAHVVGWPLARRIQAFAYDHGYLAKAYEKQRQAKGPR